MWNKDFVSLTSRLFGANIYTDARGGGLPYRLLQPAGYERAQRYPLLLFLHGAGERGDDNEAQLLHGVREFARAANRRRHPCFVIAPQCPKHQKWADWKKAKQGVRPTAALRMAAELLNQIQEEYSIDPNRIYVTGLSMGGFGTFDLLRRFPEKFAAAVIVCGGGDPEDAPKIARISMWLFHGAKDDAVPVERSRKMIAAIRNAGGTPRYTEYPNVGHDSWIRAYQARAMFIWLFAQRRGD